MSGAVNVGRLVVSVSGDVDQLKVDMREAQAIAGTATKGIINDLHGVTDATYARNDAGKRMIAAMREEIATFGMSADELKVYKASLLGVGAEAQQLIDRTNAMKSAQASFTQEAAATTTALRSHGAAANEARGHVEGFSFATVGAKRELLVLAHELSQGNYKKFGGSMMVLGEQTGAAGLLFSAAGIAVIGMGAAIIGAAVAISKGASEQREMNNALIMTGNYAGKTSDSLNALAHAAVESGGSIGEAKKTVIQLAASGKFTGDQLSNIAGAVVALEHATSASIEETIKQFESLSVQAQGHSARASTAISQATVKLDEQYHFLTLSVYNQITALEKEGDLKGASRVATDELASVTKERAEQMVANLGWLARGWNGVKESIGGVADALGNLGKKTTAAGDLKLAQQMLTSFDNEARRGGYDQKLIDANRPKLLNEIAEAQASLNRVNGEASAKSADTLAQSNAIQAAQRVDAMLLRAQTKEQGALTTALKEYHESLDRIRAGNTSEEVDPRLTESAIKAGEAALTKLHSQAVKGADDRAAVLQGALLLQQTSFDREKSIYDARGKMLDTYHSKFSMSESDFYSGRENARAEYIAAEAISYAKEASLIKGFKPKSAEEIAANKEKLDALTRQHLEFNDKIQAARAEDSVNQLAAEKATQDASDDANNKYLSSLNSQVAAIELANGKRQQAASAIAEETAAQLRLAAASMAAEAAKPVDGDHTQAVADAAKSMLATLLLEADAQERIAAALKSGEAAAASRKLADMAIQDWKDVGTSVADSLTSAFGAAGKAMGNMFKSYADNAAKQLQLTKEMALAKKLGDDDPTKLKEIDSIQKQSASAQIKSYADIAGAAQGFFEEGSRGYKALGAASQVMHAAELAMNLASIAPAMAAGAAQFFAESGWGGFAGVAAMAAVVAGFGVAVSGSGSGGGQSAADVQKAQGTGSVFGDAGAKSDSIRHSIDQLAKNSGDMLPINQGMLKALQNIESSMSGLTNLVVRTPGAIDASNFGIQTGMISTGAIGGVIGEVTHSAVGFIISPVLSLINNLWGKTTQNIVDSGLQFGGSVRGLQSGSGFDQYASVDTTKSSWFGLSKKTSNSVQTQGLDSELSSQFGLIFTGLEGSLKAASVALGGDAQHVSDVLDSLTLESTKVSLKGLSGTALTDALNGVISKSMDEISRAVFPEFESFRQVGEGYAETVMRIAGDYAKLDSILAAGGMTFGAVGMSSIAARERLIGMAGGIDALATKSASFNSAYLSAAEKLAPVQKYVADQLAAIGLAGIDTREQFKSVVLGLDKTTEAGQAQYIAMLDLADAFAQTHAATVDLSKSTQEIADERKGLQDQLDELTMSSTQLLGKQRSALDASNRSLFDQVQAATAAKAAQDAAKTSLGDVITKFKSFAESTKAFGAGLLTGNLSTLTPAQQYAETRRQFEMTKASALNGDATAESQYQAMVTAFLTASRTINGSNAQYSVDFADALKTTNDLAASAAGKVDIAQAQLDALNKQVIGIDDLNTTMQTMLDKFSAILPSTQINYGAGGASDPALVNAIKALQAEVASLRAEQQQQTGDMIASNAAVTDQAAKTVVAGTAKAISADAWSADSKAVIQ